MSFEYLEELESRIDNAETLYACPGQNTNEWYIASNVAELKPKAQRTANIRHYEVSIYRLINRMETASGDSFLVVRKVFDPGPRGEPHLHWILVDTREAAEMLRDVSHGASPYFGAVVEQTLQPTNV